uniref:Thromboxane A2 receptor n=1 Tax=Petromyzon marinus TaxID=7757 RepID=A0AAJ7TKA4_PETMA|nr:prostaglandin E2 receptor EP2 subtype-like [Petromyzon marinus]
MPGFDKNSTFIPPTYNATSSAVVFTVGVSGNIIALALLLSARRATKRTAFYALVFGLTLTDLLGSSLTGPVPLTAYAHNKTVVALGGHALCGYLSFMLLFFGVATLAILCAMAVERYLSIGHPYLYERVVRRASAWTAIRLSYLLSLALCLPPLLGFGQVKLYEPGTWCYVDMKASGGWDAAYSVLYAAILAALCLTIIVCNASVMHGLLKMMNRKRKRSLHAAPACGNAAPRFLKQQQQNQQQQQNENEEDESHQVGRHVPVAARVSSSRRRILRGEEANNLVLLVLITITSLTCTIPLTIRAFINASGAPANEALDLLGLRMYTITPILDPWIYIFCRKSLCRRLCGRWAGSRSSRSSGSSGGGVGRGGRLCGDASRRRRRLSGFEPDRERTDAAPSVVAADRSPCSTSSPSLGPRGERYRQQPQQQQPQQQPLINGGAPKAPEGPAAASPPPPTVTPSGGAAAVAATGGAARPNAAPAPAPAATASLNRRHCLSDSRRDDDSYDDGDDGQQW